MINYAENNYDRQFVNGEAMTSTHAELNCIKNIKHRRKYRLLVLKFRKDGTLTNSKPCTHCRMKLMSKGFTEVFYSNDDGKIEKSKLRTMVTRESKAQKNFCKH